MSVLFAGAYVTFMSLEYLKVQLPYEVVQKPMRRTGAKDLHLINIHVSKIRSRSAQVRGVTTALLDRPICVNLWANQE